MTCRSTSTVLTASCWSTSTGGAQLSYDNEGRLVSWQNAPSSPTTTVSDAYDGEGQRVAQRVTVSGSTTTTYYLAGGLAEIATPSSVLTNYYSVPGVVTAISVGATLSYLATDGLGSVTTALSSTTASVTAQQLYGPYGNVRYSSGSMPTAKGYTGQYADAATGLDYYNARYYDPVAGQFTSPDSVLPGDGLDPWGLSRYAYVAGDPETRTDPGGHCWLVCAVIAAVVVAAVTTVGSAVIQQVTTGHVDWGQAAAMGVGAGLVVGAAIALGPVGVAMAEGGLAAAGDAVAAGLASDVAMTGAADAAGEVVATVGEKAAVQAAMGAVMGAGEGVTQGVLAGHRGGQLLLDGEIGAVSGGIGGAAGSFVGPFAGGAIANGTANAVAQAATHVTSGTSWNWASLMTAVITGALTGELGARSVLHPLPIALFATVVDFGIQSAEQQPTATSGSPTPPPWPTGGPGRRPF